MVRLLKEWQLELMMVVLKTELEHLVEAFGHFVGPSFGYPWHLFTICLISSCISQTRKCLCDQLSKKLWQEPTVMQNWDVWSRSPAQTMPSKIKSNHTTVQQIRFYIDSPLFSIHFTFGPFLAFIRLWIECIILRPCIGNYWQVTQITTDNF